MNSSPYMPDRIISIPWLVFHYEGVSLSQMIYTPSAFEQARDDHTCLVPDATPSENYFSHMWRVWSSSAKNGNPFRRVKQESRDEEDNPPSAKYDWQQQTVGDQDGLLVRPSVF